MIHLIAVQPVLYRCRETTDHSDSSPLRLGRERPRFEQALGNDFRVILDDILRTNVLIPQDVVGVNENLSKYCGFVKVRPEVRLDENRRFTCVSWRVQMQLPDGVEFAHKIVFGPYTALS